MAVHSSVTNRFGIIATVSVVVGLTAVAAWFAWQRDPATAAGRSLLLAAADVNDRLPVSAAEREELGIQDVNTFDELVRRTDSDVFAILIDAGSADSVDWTWVQGRFAEGRLIVAINMNMGEVLARLSPASDPIEGNEGLGWTEDSPGYDDGRLFYSMLVSSSGSCTSGAFDHFDNGVTSALFKARFLQKISCVAGNLR
jgi:hypothetical protein